ncbi:Alpha/beta hydrolase [Georgfuchsia toluolica]|uniref:Alpha/beta hydrolase n=1 Tax=Georgfuchsia toluolica TaxID=424218 RepID=A0A916J3D1_9PROT|nr:alpha/beta fold hydrolase [Georgfuchsia toluolica]CAG4883969.1 Alpha/beta hydrolase [Georgfuchsia toluolica]
MAHERILIEGPSGDIEVFVEPHETPQGMVIVGHPHPLFGGSADNKVVTTLARAFREMGCVTLRPNFRGVGASKGKHDNGIAETDDLHAVYAFARSHFGRIPLYLAGFSFGAFVVTRLAKRLADEGGPARRLVLVGTAAGYIEGARSYETSAVPQDTIVIHGAKDETVPLENVLQWAEPLELPVIVVPGADHFFHRRLHIIRAIVQRSFHPLSVGE